MDIDEDAFRADRVSASLYGYMTVPFRRELVQAAKAASPVGDESAMHGIASDIVHSMSPERLYLIGPGTTTRAILMFMGLEGTLLGVDVVRGGKLVARDADEARLVQLTQAVPASIVVTVIGGQGHVFGRGNQPLSPLVIRQVGKENIVVAAVSRKLYSLQGRPLLVDTGDEELDRELSGYLQVVTGLNDRTVCRVAGQAASSTR
jgi:predicted polyphosphate/ATP-dependent NAD kinase